MIETVLLVVFGVAALGAGLLMLLARDPMRVALALIAAMLALAGIYAMLGMHVIAVFQVLIYVGAVMVFMVYAIMLLDARDPAYRLRFSRLLLPAIVGAVLLLGVLAPVLWRATPSGPKAQGDYGVAAFSEAFLQQFWLHFELISVLLVVALVAALAILRIERRGRG